MVDGGGLFFGVLFLEAGTSQFDSSLQRSTLALFPARRSWGPERRTRTGAKCWTLVSESKIRKLKRSNHHDHGQLGLMGEGVIWVETSDVLAGSPVSRHVTFVRISQTFSVADRLTGR